MKITFQMGSPLLNEINTIHFWEIKEKAQVQIIKQITHASLLFNTIEEKVCTIKSAESSEIVHNLTIYLPDYDKNQKIIGWTGTASLNLKSTDTVAASKLIAELQSFF